MEIPVGKKEKRRICLIRTNQINFLSNLFQLLFSVIFCYHIAALLLYSFSLMFLYLYVCFACWALINLILYGPCIVIYLRNKNQPNALSFLIYFTNINR